jgi:diadenosine tetraphosphatase ApaH/serine/threonine PP2A family protein phosphatase
MLPPELEDQARLLRWNDPGNWPGMHVSERGFNIQCFGPDITKDFLERHDYRLLIRSHQLVPGGYHFGHNGLCLTVFSAPNYW